ASRDIMEITDSRSVCIVGNGNKDQVLDAALAENEYDLPLSDIGVKREICRLPVRRFNGRTRAFLRIQDGCNNFCSYCIVPHTRGRSRSLALPDVLEQAAIFSEEGYRELVITGINVGKYGQDLDEDETIYTLLARLCREFPVMRFRLSSIEPTEVNDSLLELMIGAPNFMPHLHIPLQSGDDTILRRMNRHYPVATFARAVRQSHAALPHVAIGCDILSGFPGEDNTAHENTLQLLADLPVTYLHVFPFSRRPGTPAASMQDQVPKHIKAERVRQLRDLGHEKKLEFYRRHVGTTRQVLAERHNKETGRLKGFSENYIPVQFQGPARLAGQVVAIRIDRLEIDEPYGTLQNE
ncbi:MAG TPA: MiaB/RimO family radical SAM methylthiotransferase, partial [Desulfobacteraceae bacterium]|nr:MiaB/RimO family radical SAM methylthiotransferase [Desulfobacteraceae bacterium]